MLATTFSTVSGGTQIGIHGQGFTPDSWVMFGDTPAPQVHYSAPSYIQATVPPHAPGAVDVTIGMAGGTVVLPDAFLYGFDPGWGSVATGLPSAAEVPDPVLRARIASEGYPWKVYDYYSSVVFVLVPAGSYDMGCSPSDTSVCGSDESPVHEVAITRPFYLAQYEVTQGQWTNEMGSNPSQFQGYPDSFSRPVERLSWNLAQSFLTQQGLRFPTEAEWEYAYRAGTTTAFHGWPASPDGTDAEADLGTIGWFSSNAASATHPVGQKAPNGLGLYDMSGNVWEMVGDWYGSSYYAGSPWADPQGPPASPSTILRVKRGGAYQSAAGSCRASVRSTVALVSTGEQHTGFRAARTPGPIITGISPAAGPPNGGTTVHIYGRFFGGLTSVKFGANTATIVQSSENYLRVQSPAASQPGSVDIVVTSASGSVTLSDGFTYLGAPVIDAVSPDFAAPDGGVEVTVTGGAFANAGTLKLVRGGTETIIAFDVVSDTQIRFTMPALPLGLYDLVVANAYGATTRAGAILVGNKPEWAGVLQGPPDPAVVTSATLRAAIVATNRPWRVSVSLNPATQTTMEFVLVPPGIFNMGCSPSDATGCGSSESPVHPVTITAPFYLARYETSQGEWNAKMGSNPSFHEVIPYLWDNYPVEQVTWTDVQGFLAATGTRLPTEAEWEYAYRAGTTTAFHGWPAYTLGTNQSSLLGNIATFNTSETGLLGFHAPNGFGLYDMAGNVWEWVNDWYGSYSSSGQFSQVDPQGPATGTAKVMRGGSYLDNSGWCRASARLNYPTNYTYRTVGFRVARNP